MALACRRSSPGSDDVRRAPRAILDPRWPYSQRAFGERDDDDRADHAQGVWHSRSADEVAAALGVDPERGLDAGEVQRRLAQYGPNELATEPPPSVWAVARGQLSNPMNIMLLIVAVASFAVGQVATGIFVLGLVTFNVVMGSAQELQGAGQRRGAGAAAGAACPGAPRSARRGGRVDELVPGDIVAARGRRRRPGRRPDRDVGDAGGAGGGADRRERAGGEGRDERAGGRDGARRPHEPGLPEHAGHAGDGRRRRDGDGSGDPDGPHRRHGHRDPAAAVAAAARARRHDEGVRAPGLGGGGDHRDLRHRPRPGRRERSSCCASRPRSPRSRSACRRSCRRCCPRARSISPSRRRW